MLKSNDIDIFLVREELLNIFQELLIQLKNKKLNYQSQFNIINNLNKKNFSQITILDNISVGELIEKNFIFNNFIFIIDNISENSRQYLDNNFVNYECLDLPISCLKLLIRSDNLLNEINNARLERDDLKKFSYSFNLNTVYVNNSSLYLTDKENEIFQILIENIGSSLSKKQLLSKVWSYDQNIDTHTLETHIYTLRKKLKKKLGLQNIIRHEEDGYFIKD